MDKITLESQNITVEGHYGTWYAIDRMVIGNKPYYLLEYEKYGDESLAVIVDENGTLIMEDVSGGLDQLPDFLNQRDIKQSRKNCAKLHHPSNNKSSIC